MATPARLDMTGGLLDHELVDADGNSCGMVDGLELREGTPGPEVLALLVGPGAWGPRLPALLAVLAGALFGKAVVRIPWEQVQHVGEVVVLKTSAGALGLGRVDRVVNAWIRKLPGANQAGEPNGE
jgi:sporulation protein YlmC with PRC-barrel domain